MQPKRLGRYKSVHNNGRFGKNARVLSHNGPHRVMVFANDPTESAPDPVEDGMERETLGPDWMVTIIHDRGMKYNLNLSRLTESELRAMKEALDYAFEQALPVCQDRDTIAKKAADDGNGDYYRLYRPPGRISYVSGKVSEDDRGLQVGRPGVRKPDEPDEGGSAGSSESGNVVDQSGSTESSRSSINNLPTVGLPPSLG